MDYTGRNLQGQSFKGQTLKNAKFCNADIRGADFSSADLENADFSNTKTGIETSYAALIFIFSFLVSLFAGYLAVFTGTTIQYLLKSGDRNMEAAGYITLGYIVIFLGIALWKGLFRTIKKVLFLMVIFTSLLSLFIYFTGLGTGVGALRCVFALLLVMVMSLAGTISRATAGTLASNIIFFAVAIGGSVFSSTIGGGIGAALAAISCGIISKRALNENYDSSIIRKIALKIGARFGTSFIGANLTNANFTGAKISNTDFSNSNLTGVDWTDVEKKFVIIES